MILYWVLSQFCAQIILLITQSWVKAIIFYSFTTSDLHRGTEFISSCWQNWQQSIKVFYTEKKAESDA